jgi:peptide-methionine (R)-S-oxide reductase
MNKKFPFTKTEQEWKNSLTQEEYDIMRKQSTERAFTHEFADKKDDGIYICKGCGQDLFNSTEKFDSGTGWPSFSDPIADQSVGTETDYKLIWPRTEVHCSNCGSHLGHVFNDGPTQSGKRYCMNGCSLEFKKHHKKK